MEKLPPAKKERPGRQSKIDMTLVEGMAFGGASNVDIAEFLGLSEGVIRKRCKDALLRGRANLRMRLRQAQLKEAFKGNAAMLIWCGKQMLGQTDKQQHEHTGNPKKPLAMKITHTIVDPAPRPPLGQPKPQ